MRAAVPIALLLFGGFAACADERLAPPPVAAPRSNADIEAELARANADVLENDADSKAAQQRIALGGCHVPTEMPQLSSTPVRSDVPVIVADKQGRLFRAGFDARAWTPLADPGLERSASLQATKDGRWILHGGSKPGADERTWWLFDATTSTDHLLPGHAAWPLLSADGEHVAQVVRTDAPEFRVVEVIDMPAGQPARFPLPVPARDEFDSTTRLSWADGNQIVAHNADDHFLLDRTRGQWRPVRLEEGGHAVFDGDRRLSLLEPLTLPPANSADPVYSDLWHAIVHQPQGVLKITTPDYHVLRVAEAMSDNCVGGRINALGWVDGHRLLAYAINMRESAGTGAAERRLFVYDLDTQGSTPLFVGKDVEAFVWPDWANPPEHQHSRRD